MVTNQALAIRNSEALLSPLRLEPWLCGIIKQYFAQNLPMERNGVAVGRSKPVAAVKEDEC